MSKQNKKFVFSDALASVVPPEIVDTMENSNKELFMEKVKETRKTTWWIFMQVLSLFQIDPSAHPSVKKTTSDLFQFLERCEASPHRSTFDIGMLIPYQIMDDAQDDLFHVTQALAALQLVLACNRESNMPELARQNLQNLTK
jgi:hypothetical protein